MLWTLTITRTRAGLIGPDRFRFRKSAKKSLFARKILSRIQVKTNVVELLIWTRFTNRLFKIEPETRTTKADETHHEQMRRTLSAVPFPTERPCVFALGTAQDSVSRTHISGFWSWILWHQRDSGPLQQVTSVTRSFCSTPAPLSATLR